MSPLRSAAFTAARWDGFGCLSSSPSPAVPALFLTRLGLSTETERSLIFLLSSSLMDSSRSLTALSTAVSSTSDPPPPPSSSLSSLWTTLLARLDKVVVGWEDWYFSTIACLSWRRRLIMVSSSSSSSSGSTSGTSSSDMLSFLASSRRFLASSCDRLGSSRDLLASSRDGLLAPSYDLLKPPSRDLLGSSREPLPSSRDLRLFSSSRSRSLSRDLLCCDREGGERWGLAAESLLLGDLDGERLDDCLMGDREDCLFLTLSLLPRLVGGDVVLTDCLLSSGWDEASLLDFASGEGGEEEEGVTCTGGVSLEILERGVSDPFPLKATGGEATPSTTATTSLESSGERLESSGELLGSSVELLEPFTGGGLVRDSSFGDEPGLSTNGD